VNHTVLAAGRC